MPTLGQEGGEKDNSPPLLFSPAGITHSNRGRNQRERDRVGTGHEGQSPGHTVGGESEELNQMAGRRCPVCGTGRSWEP